MRPEPTKRPARPRGTGSIYRRKQDGGQIWWIRCPGGKPESSGTTKKADAQKLLERRLAEGQEMIFKPAEVCKAAYEDLEAMLLADLKVNRRRSLGNVEKFRLPKLRAFFKGMNAKDITYDVVTGYVARRMDEAAPATVLYELKLLKRMFKIAHRAGRISGMPHFPTVSVGDNARKGFCSPEEIERVIEHLPEHAKPIVRCLYLTGWRTSEVLTLTWARVDFDAATLRLDSTNSKTGKSRTFPFAGLPTLVELLHEQRERTSMLEREDGRIVCHVFHLEGDMLKSFRTAWRDAVKKAGLPGLRPHDLRRSAARNLVRAGVPEGVVMKLCGWTTRSMFDRYNVADMRDLEEGVGRLSQFLEQRVGPRAKRHVGP